MSYFDVSEGGVCLRKLRPALYPYVAHIVTSTKLSSQSPNRLSAHDAITLAVMYDHIRSFHNERTVVMCMKQILGSFGLCDHTNCSKKIDDITPY